MAYGVDAYGRPQPDDPNQQQLTQKGQQNPALGQQYQLQRMDSGSSGGQLMPPQRQDNTAPQQQGQQPATPRQDQSAFQGRQMSMAGQQQAAGSAQGQAMGNLANGGAQFSQLPQQQTNSGQQPQQGTSGGQQPGGYGSPQEAIAALYAKHGVADGGAGSGFTDAAYWAKQSTGTGGWDDYWNNRLDSDLSGTGTDAGGNNAPQYQQAQMFQGQSAGPAPTFTPYQFDQTPMNSYQGDKLSDKQLPAYMAAQISQYQAPGQAQGINDSMSGLMAKMIANPETMSDQNVAQLKEQQKEQALSMQQQMQAQGGQQAAAQGMYGSGAQMANDQRSRDTTLNSLLSGYRGIDLQKMGQDRTDQLNVMNAGQGFTNSLTNQAQGNYGATLQGQQAQANQNFQSQQSQADAVKFNLGRETAQAGINQAASASQQNARQFGLQAQQAQAGQNQFGASFGQQNWQTLMAQQLAQSQMAQNQGQFNSNLQNNQYQFGVNNANRLNGF